MAITRFSSNVAPFLVCMLAILGSTMGIQLSFSAPSANKLVPSSGTVEYSSTRILTSFKEDWFDNASRAIEVAKKFDMVITWCEYFISEMRSANPDLLLLRYEPICGVYNGSWGWSEALAGGWLLKDSSGEFVHSTIWQTLYLCDPNNPQYRDWLGNECKGVLDQYNFDGIFGDGASAVTRPMYDLSGDPINPATQAVYTDHDWSIALVGLNQVIKQKIGSKLYIGNGCMCGSGETGGWAHFADYQKLYNTLDGAMIECSIFVYWEGFRSEEQWTQDIDFIKWHTSQGKITLLWSYVGDTSDAESLTEYCYCSYLLGIESFNDSFTYTEPTMETSYTMSFLNITFGTPMEDYHQCTNNTHIYERNFTRTKVLVNPTDSDYVVSLDRYYKTRDGQTVSQIALKGHSGVVLLE